MTAGSSRTFGKLNNLRLNISYAVEMTVFIEDAYAGIEVEMIQVSEKVQTSDVHTNSILPSGEVGESFAIAKR
jgi:hypothetical protein